VEGDAFVSLLRDGNPLDRQRIRLSRGETMVRFTVTPETPGERRYAIRVSLPGDEEPRNDVAETSVRVVGPPRILWIGTDPGVPEGSGFQVIHARPDALAHPANRSGEFDAVVLANVEAEALPPSFVESLPRYVGGLGGGLLMLGAARSFGPGGYRGTPIEEILPVTLDPGDRRQRSALGLVLVLDKSGSMGDRMGTVSKMAAAREAALAMAGLLEAGDRFGLLVFDSLPRRILPLRADPGRQQLRAILDGVQPGGGTRLFPALAEAVAMLQPLQLPRRHVVLVTDGRGEGGDFAAYAGGIVATGITLSVIAVGDDADAPLLRTLATAGRGRFVLARDARSLAAALRRETVLARGPVVVEGRTAVVAAHHAVLGRLAEEPVPPLHGYISTAPKPLAAVPMRAETGDPVLALDSFGLGRTAALTTDPDGAWGADWRGWRGWPRLLTQLLGWLLRAPTPGQVTILQEADRDGWTLTAGVQDQNGAPQNGLALLARLHGAGGREQAISLEQRGLGRYSGRLPSRAVRPTQVIVEHHAQGTRSIAGQGWIGLSYPEEYRIRGPNRPLLEELRRITEGVWYGEPGLAPRVRSAPARSVSLGPALALAALGLVLLNLVLEQRAVRFAARRGGGVGRGLRHALRLTDR
jgi:uncharacterized membrane protein